MSVTAMLQGNETYDIGTLQSALTLARRLNVPLQGLCALPNPASAALLATTPEFPGVIAEVASSLAELQETMIKSARQTFHDVVGTGAHGVECTFDHQVASPERAATNAATLSDAVVFNRHAAQDNGALHEGFEHVLVTARLPVVLSGSGDMTQGPVVIGWDGSHGAARSVRFHLPLIRSFGDVLIAHQKSDAERDDHGAVTEPETLRNWLMARGVKAQVSHIEGEVAGGLLAMASGAEAAMIVAGAYGHSRLGERLFGGTTRRLLQAKDAPALALAR